MTVCSMSQKEISNGDPRHLSIRRLMIFSIFKNYLDRGVSHDVTLSNTKPKAVKMRTGWE